ncbi:GNAT family N-acetyltransferase [Nocardioides nanhaiensis]|uniref:GNAT family N-acetyltransferase n=1 Tax=Nocardioides nanhaiensis TaxID=1476871 RepID=A0ABP8W7W8_9ACTN
MDTGGWRIQAVPYAHPDAVRMVAEVQAEYVVRYGGPDRSPVDPLTFLPPHGIFVVGYQDGEPVATGAWRRSDVPALGARATAEVKRMYVAPAARGRGRARAVLAELERTAAAHGVEAMVLETGVAQPEAIALYESSGYVPVPPYGFYRDSPLSRCFGKRLAGPSGPGGD